RSAEPPAIIRMLVPPAIAPAASIDPDCLVDNFHDTRRQYSESVRRAGDLELGGILICAPIHPGIFSLEGAIAFIAVHDRRHIWQAEEVRKATGFPCWLPESNRRKIP